jgi:hypothetical protein
MSSFLKKILFIITLAPMIIGCTDYNVSIDEIDNKAALMMDVASVEVVPYAGEDSKIMPVSAGDLTKQWFERKIKASNRGEKRFVIEIADAKTYRNPQSSNAKFYAYTTEIKVNYRLYEPQKNLAVMNADSVLKMTREVKKDAAIADEDKFFALTHRQLLERMDKEFPAQIEKYFSQHIVMMR